MAVSDWKGGDDSHRPNLIRITDESYQHLLDGDVPTGMNVHVSTLRTVRPSLSDYELAVDLAHRCGSARFVLLDTGRTDQNDLHFLAHGERDLTAKHAMVPEFVAFDFVLTVGIGDEDGPLVGGVSGMMTACGASSLAETARGDNR